MIARLNDIELEIVRLACEGLTYKEIAGKLYYSPRTIDGYRDRIFEKLNARNMVHAVAKLYECGILKPKEFSDV